MGYVGVGAVSGQDNHCGWICPVRSVLMRRRNWRVGEGGGASVLVHCQGCQGMSQL